MITEGFYLGRFNPKATKADLWNYLEAEVTYAKAITENKNKRIDELITRRHELQDANSQYVERARKIEALNNDHVAQLQVALDRIDFMQGEYDAAVAQHLEQDTWARMEIERLKALVSDWQGEAKAWAEMYGKERQHNEEEYRKVNEWVKTLSVLGRFQLLVFDLPICIIGFLVLAGAVPPVVDLFGWWF